MTVRIIDNRYDSENHKHSLWQWESHTFAMTVSENHRHSLWFSENHRHSLWQWESQTFAMTVRITDIRYDSENHRHSLWQWESQTFAMTVVRITDIQRLWQWESQTFAMTVRIIDIQRLWQWESQTFAMTERIKLRKIQLAFDRDRTHGLRIFNSAKLWYQHTLLLLLFAGTIFCEFLRFEKIRKIKYPQKFLPTYQAPWCFYNHKLRDDFPILDQA